MTTFTCEVHFKNRGRGFRKVLVQGAVPMPTPIEPGRVPRVSRLMALALRFEQLLRDGVVTDYRQLAELGQVSRARITQIMNLLLLAPDIQEAVLFLPRTRTGQDRIHLRQLQAIALTPAWRNQQKMWQDLQASPGRS